MVSTKNFRLLVLVAAVAFMLVAVTSVEAAPSNLDTLRCVEECIEWPDCEIPCRAGYYCAINTCTCRPFCKKGIIP
ncbi:hypothetical protein BGX23_008665 [Mortierella sp. AD031]|nr:hypothetical protein BGX23_008665 [Mortierella sp. AD031]KAG0204219.1 hypothetical protein BGX33_008661 [Mortierella sp. NVP41]